MFVSDAAHSSVVVINTDNEKQWSIDFPDRALAVKGKRDIMFMVLLRTAGGRTGLYVTFMSGCRLFAVDLDRIDECAAAAARPSIVEAGRKPYRITVLGSDNNSRMYFRRPTENEIWSWNVNNPFHEDSFQLVSIGRDCRAPVHVAPGYGGFLFVMKTNFADYMIKTIGSLGAFTLIEPITSLTPLPLTTSIKNNRSEMLIDN